MRTPTASGAANPAKTPPNHDGAARPDRLRAHLGRVDAALRQWDAWEANQRRPAAARPPLSRPAVTRPSLTDLRVLLLEELARHAPEDAP